MCISKDFRLLVSKEVMKGNAAILHSILLSQTFNPTILSTLYIMAQTSSKGSNDT